MKNSEANLDLGCFLNEWKINQDYIIENVHLLNWAYVISVRVT